MNEQEHKWREVPEESTAGRPYKLEHCDDCKAWKYTMPNTNPMRSTGDVFIVPSNTTTSGTGS